jgi:hypothetical protein
MDHASPACCGHPPAHQAGTEIARHNAALAARAVPEWQAVLDALLISGLGGLAGPVGFWGISLGGRIGVELAAAEPIRIPVEFLLQWDDELVLRTDGLALFDAFASRDKTLHANSGGHMDVPRFEVDSSLRFFSPSPLRHVNSARPAGGNSVGRPQALVAVSK